MKRFVVLAMITLLVLALAPVLSMAAQGAGNGSALRERKRDGSGQVEKKQAPGGQQNGQQLRKRDGSCGQDCPQGDCANCPRAAYGECPQAGTGNCPFGGRGPGAGMGQGQGRGRGMGMGMGRGMGMGQGRGMRHGQS